MEEEGEHLKFIWNSRSTAHATHSRSQKGKRKQYCRQETRSWDNYSEMENTSSPDFSPLPGKRQLAKCFDLNGHFRRGSEAKG